MEKKNNKYTALLNVMKRELRRLVSRPGVFFQHHFQFLATIEGDFLWSIAHVRDNNSGFWGNAEGKVTVDVSDYSICCSFL